MKKYYLPLFLLMVVGLNAYQWTFHNRTNYPMHVRLETTLGPTYTRDIGANSSQTIDTGMYCPNRYYIDGKNNKGEARNLNHGFNGPLCTGWEAFFNPK